MVEQVLRADEEFLAEHPDSTLFAYIVGHSEQGGARTQSELLAEWEREEHDREDRAAGERRARTTRHTACRMPTTAWSPRGWCRHNCAARWRTCKAS